MTTMLMMEGTTVVVGSVERERVASKNVSESEHLRKKNFKFYIFLRKFEISLFYLIKIIHKNITN